MSTGEDSTIIRKCTSYRQTGRSWTVLVCAAGFSMLAPRFTVCPTDAQHIMFKEIMGMYAPCMDQIMEDDVPGEPKTILDLGCGSGSWCAFSPLLHSPQLYAYSIYRIMEAAREYPNCNAVAVDLVPMQSQ